MITGLDGTCAACGAPLDREPGVGLVDARSGDDGGTYDLCEERVLPDGSFGKHRLFEV